MYDARAGAGVEDISRQDFSVRIQEQGRYNEKQDSAADSK